MKSGLSKGEALLGRTGYGVGRQGAPPVPAINDRLAGHSTANVVTDPRHNRSGAAIDYDQPDMRARGGKTGSRHHGPKAKPNVNVIVATPPSGGPPGLPPGPSGPPMGMKPPGMMGGPGGPGPSMAGPPPGMGAGPPPGMGAPPMKPPGVMKRGGKILHKSVQEFGAGSGPARLAKRVYAERGGK